ncbi:MAG: terpene cyclase/mutase family protein [Kiritimatiellae bacterium]|nr:terpene cyclase/mutase family protein [Kiritimatiellia bacterium]
MAYDNTQNELNQSMEAVDERLAEINKMYDDVTIWQRLKILSVGLKSPRQSKEYKEAMIELQRLMAPAAAVIIPVVSVLLLVVLSASQSVQERIIDTTMIEEEPIKDIEDIKDEPPPEQDMQEVDVDVPIDTPVVQVDQPQPNTPLSPQPAEFNSALIVKSPVILKNVYGVTRGAGHIGALRARYGGSPQAEEAVMRALRWLKKNQHGDGSWGGQKTAMTGLGLLTFLAHGEKPDSEEFGATVQRAVEFLLNNQRSDGKFNHMDGNEYAHPIATYALCEAYGMIGHPNILAAAEKALVPIIQGQHPTGGWTYKMDPKPGEDGKYRDDTSYMGWCAQALKAAKLSHVPVEGLEKAIKLAVRGFKKNANPNGGFGYCDANPTGLSSVGTLCMLLLGAGNDKDCRNGQKFLDSWTPSFSSMVTLKNTVGNGNLADQKKKMVEKVAPEERKWYTTCAQYYFYYATQCKFHEGGVKWKKWNNAMMTPYCNAQIVEKNAIKDAKGKDCDIGHWENVDTHTDRPVMDTCLAALQLEVYYRYLPTTGQDAVKVDEEIVADATDVGEDIKVDAPLDL